MTTVINQETKVVYTITDKYIDGTLTWKFVIPGKCNKLGLTVADVYVDLNKLSKYQLDYVVKWLELKGVSKLKKNELIKRILEHPNYPEELKKYTTINE